MGGIMVKSHFEIVAARKYYGKHATGAVVLVNGEPWHSNYKDARALVKRLREMGMKEIKV
jgi:hypothetical protein